MTSKYTNKNGVKLLAAVMVFAMAFAGCVVLCGDDSQTDAATSSDITYIKGNMSATQTYGTGSKVVVDGDLTIQAGATLEIEDGASLTINEGVTVTVSSAPALETSGSISIDNLSKIVVNGAIVVKTGEVAGTISNDAATPDDSKGFYLNGSITLERKASITASSSGTILLGETATIAMQSVKDNASLIEKQTLLVTDGAKVDFNGVVKGVTVSAYSTGTHTKGSVSIVNSGNEISRLSFTTVLENISVAYPSSGSENKIKDAVDAVLYVSGTVPAEYTLTVKANEATNLFYPDGNQGSDVPMKGIVRIADDSELNVQAKATLVSEAWSVLEVDGTLDINGNSANKATIKLDGLVYVSGSIDSGEYSVMTVDSPDTPVGYVIIEGEGSATFSYALDAGVKVFGGSYYDSTNTVTVIKGVSEIIDAAVVANISVVKIGSITEESGHLFGMEPIISEDLIVPEDVSLEVIGNLVVDKGFILTFEMGSIQNLSSGTITVKGQLIDYNLNGYLNTQVKADVRSVDYDYTYYTYTTLAAALTGEEKEINIFNDVLVDEDLTIPEGYTVNVASTETITVDEKVSLTVDGKIIIGDLDCINKNGSGDDVGKVFVNGEFVSAEIFTAVEKAFIYGAYIGGGSAKKIISVEASAEKSSTVSQIDIYGDYVVGDLVFTKGTSLSVFIHGKITADSITMNGGNLTVSSTSTAALVGTLYLDDMTFDSQGKTTATVVAPQGSESQAIIVLDKAIGTIVSKASEVEDVTTYDLKISAFKDGTFDVKTGIVTVVYDTAADGAKVIISEGAVAQIPAGSSLVIDQDVEFIVNGVLSVKGTLEFSATFTKAPVINGSLIAEKGTVTINSMVVLGSVEIEDAVTFTVNGNGVAIGSASEPESGAYISGEIDTLNSDCFMKAYAGADVSSLDLTSSVSYFYVNKSLFATVFFDGDVAYKNAIGVSELNDIPGLKPVSGTSIAWTKENGTSIDVDDNMPNNAEAYYEMSLLTIGVRFSVETGTMIQMGPDFYSSTTTISTPYTAGEYPFVAKALSGYIGNVVVELWVDNVNMGVQTGTVKLTSDMAGKQVVIVSKFSDTPTPEPTPVDPSKEVIVSTSVVDGKVIVSVISLDGGYLVAGTEVEVTFTTLVETTAFGQTVYKPTPVTETITIGDDKPTISNNAYELADILGDKYAVINVVSTIGTTGYGNMSLNYKG